MNNEQYLILSYGAVALICLVLAMATYGWLRRSFASTVHDSSSPSFSKILKKLFLIGIIFPAFFGFFSVSFHSCSKDTYEKIIEERTYLVAKNQEQLSQALFYIVIALLGWGVIGAGALFIQKKERLKKNSAD